MTFKTHFRQVDKEYRCEATTAQAGYHASNAAYQPKPLPIEQDMESLALSNAPFTTTLSTFTTAVADTSTVTLQVTNPVPTFTPDDFTSTVLATVAAASGGNNNNHNRNQNQNHTNNNAIPAGYGYYWSHGHIPQRGTDPHNSTTCRNQKPGHKTEATAENKLGGKTRVWRYSPLKQDGGAVYDVTTKSFCYFTNKQSKLINVDRTPPTIKRTITDTGSTGNYVNASTTQTNKSQLIQ